MPKCFIYLAVVLSLGLISCQSQDSERSEHEVTEVVKGPHGGRMLVDGEFGLEVTIYEQGVPPEYRVYTYKNNESVGVDGVRLTIELKRFGGRLDVIQFAKVDDHLLGDKVIDEPHSFDVTVVAERDRKTHRWEYESYEGRTTIKAQAAMNSGIVIETVGPASIKQTLRVFGRIGPNEDQLKDIAPRFPGVVKEVRKRLGETVSKDDVLAVIESNESLQLYEVKSGIAGTVIRKDITPGEFVNEGEVIYTVADLSEVWVDLNVPRQDFDRLKLGQAVTLSAGEGTNEACGKVSYISPFGAQDTQTMLARVELQNPDGRWRPGFFVVGDIVVEEGAVPVAVKTKALQSFRDWDVVFLQDGDIYEIAILELGRRDNEWVEVLSGLTRDQKYVSENSFIIKADIGKSGATHDH